jgi:ribosomal protein S12 methylthiotransferase accessory factor
VAAPFSAILCDPYSLERDERHLQQRSSNIGAPLSRAAIGHAAIALDHEQRTGRAREPAEPPRSAGLPLVDLRGVVRPDDPPLPAALTTESGLRTRHVDELRSFLQPYLNDYGITRVAHLTGFDYVGLPVHMAVKPQGLSLSSGSGKGSVTNASWVSAVMEAAEQTVWETLDRPVEVASESIMRKLGAAVVDAARLPLLRGAAYNPTLPIAWTTGWDIVQGEEVYVPNDIVQLTSPSFGALHAFVSGSNGLASGAHVLEAVLSGLQESIERDGVTLNSHVQPAPLFSPGTLLAEVAPSVAERIERSRLRLEARDCTTEIGVPTISAYLYDDEGGTGTFKGAGAGPSTAIALVRAVTEAAQARCLIVAGARDDSFESARAAGTGSYTRSAPEPLPELNGRVDMRLTSVLDTIQWMVDCLVGHGFDRVVVVRHTSHGDPVQVVRVLVPGLEGYPFAHAGWGERAKTLLATELSVEQEQHS